MIRHLLSKISARDSIFKQSSMSGSKKALANIEALCNPQQFNCSATEAPQLEERVLLPNKATVLTKHRHV